MLSRRSLFLAVPSVGLLAGCSLFNLPSLTIDQAIADALIVATALKGQLPSIIAWFPNILTTIGLANVTSASSISDGLDAAITALTGLTSASAMAVPQLTTAEIYINDTLNVLVTIGQIVAVVTPQVGVIVMVIRAAISLAVPIETLVNRLKVPSTTPKMARFGVLPMDALVKKIQPLDIDTARDVLRVSTH